MMLFDLNYGTPTRTHALVAAAQRAISPIHPSIPSILLWPADAMWSLSLLFLIRRR